jgi:hypothetical protein
VAPAPQAQVPPVHDWPAAQALPQAPQFIALVARSTQAPPQLVVPPAQVPCTQAPAEQIVPLAQALPHEPQLATSALRSTHDEPQAMRPVLQVQAPLVQL